MSYPQYILEDMRLVLLRLLNGAPGKSANCRVLQKGLNTIGHKFALDKVRTEVQWLDEQGLVLLEKFKQDPENEYMIATLTTRGRDVSEGTSKVPGVAEPS